MVSYSYIYNILKLKDALTEIFANNDSFEEFIKEDFKTSQGKNVVYHLLTFVDEKDSADQVAKAVSEELKRIINSYSLEEDNLIEQVENSIRAILNTDIEDEIDLQIENAYEDFDSYEDYEEYSEAKDNNFSYLQYLNELRKDELAGAICIAQKVNGGYVAIPTNAPISISKNEPSAIETLIAKVAEISGMTIQKVKNYLNSKKLQVVDTNAATNMK